MAYDSTRVSVADSQSAIRKIVYEQEERRVWRVLFWHLKAMFEAADSGVIAVEDIIMPYIVTPDGRTIAEHVAPKLAEMRDATHHRLPTAGGLISG
jgi:hypothetical protein